MPPIDSSTIETCRCDKTTHPAMLCQYLLKKSSESPTYFRGFLLQGFWALKARAIPTSEGPTARAAANLASFCQDFLEA